VIISSDARQHGGDRQGVAVAKSRAHGCARIDSPPQEPRSLSEYFPWAAFGKDVYIRAMRLGLAHNIGSVRGSGCGDAPAQQIRWPR